ncbi:putative Auxin-induced protein 5NG4 [Heracleum sosnowskyi]|uniref:Auxin-induced protein 5NG4 n=1 Tax=Heracleum sosnowskyi TaxID=360622 RepID=A0AAD8MZK4_9APIA|nr:putative Auxin-induced protein 5NG4 [Heracleum sosnowskyi]
MEGVNQKQMLDRETRDMISAINRRLQHLHKLQRGGDTSNNDDDDDDDDDDQGVRVITLAGSNVGATMRSELDDLDGDVEDDSEDDPFSALVNSNFQAINNSLMIDGSYNTNDPGVHLEIYEKQEAKTEQVTQKRGKKKEGGTKNKGSKSSKSEHHSEGNSGD